MTFFHEKALERKKRNKIRKLIDENGMVGCSQNGKARVVVEHFKNLFKSNVNASTETNSQGIESFMTAEENHELLRPFTTKEVRTAFFPYISQKPSLDGMHVNNFLSTFVACCWTGDN